MATSHSDHLVGADDKRLRDREAERLGGLEIKNQLEFGRLLDRNGRPAWKSLSAAQHERQTDIISVGGHRRWLEWRSRQSQPSE